MKIKSLLLRQGGTIVDGGHTKYHFKPDANGEHICEVTDQAHIAAFLACTEGYAAVDEPRAKTQAVDLALEEVPDEVDVDAQGDSKKRGRPPKAN